MTTPNPTRRDFIRNSSAAAAALGLVPNAFAGANDVIKVGLIGCGGRGTGAIENICEAAGTSHNVKIHALGDVFADRLNNCLEASKKGERSREKMDVSADRCFVGFDAYKKVVDCCDLIMLATPPGFRPQHLEYAIKAGKNIFTEKPVAVDPAGIRKVLAAADEAKAKGLCIVAGTQRRHQAPYVESMKRIHAGAIGDVVAGRVFWNQGNIWAVPRKEGWGDMEYQLRNWYHFLWLCGDCIVEQHVHNLDVACWVLGAHPVRAVGMGGREVNTGPEWGESFDHYAVDYEFPNGVHVLSMCRQISGCESEVAEHFVGTKGRWHSEARFEGTDLPRIRVRGINPYVQEHIDLLEAIAAAKPVNELKQVAESTMTAILGRLSAHTGKALTWDQALNAKVDTFPKELGWDVKLPGPKIAKPGVTELG